MTSTPPDAPRGQHRSNRSLKGRTSLVTAAAIAGVLVAGTAAVAANIGILNAADSSAIGDLAVTDELLPAAAADTSTTVLESTTVPTTVPTTTVATTPDAPLPQQYDIENTGTVWVMTTTSGLALDHVVAETGWNPVLTQSDLRSLQVDFTNGDRTIVFTAALADDGSVVVDVTEPTTVIGAAPIDTSAPIAPSAAPTPTAATYSDEYDDDHDEYEYEDDDHEDHDEYEYEDHDEHEGADDDD